MAWIWFNGLAREAGHWGGLPAKAERQLDEKVITFDLSSAPANKLSSSKPQTNDAIQAFATQIPRTHSLKLLAVDSSASMALQYAATEPRVKRVVLVNPLSRDDLVHLRVKWLQMARFFACFRANRDSLAAQHRALSLLSNSQDRCRQLASIWAEIQNRRPVSMAHCWLELKRSLRQRMPAPSQLLHCQIEVLVSRADAIISPKSGQHLARYYSSPLVLNLTAGHDIAVDDPHWLLHQLAVQNIVDDTAKSAVR
jgi:hypothetical protein